MKTPKQLSFSFVKVSRFEPKFKKVKKKCEQLLPFLILGFLLPTFCRVIF
jgi:hypothetical protein